MKIRLFRNGESIIYSADGSRMATAEMTWTAIYIEYLRSQQIDANELVISHYDDGGTTAFNAKGQQVPKAQASWLLLYAEHLAERGIDPTAYQVTLPSGKKAQIVCNADGGFNWIVTGGALSRKQNNANCTY